MTASPAGPDGATAATGRRAEEPGVPLAASRRRSRWKPASYGERHESGPLGDARRRRHGPYLEDSARPERDDPVEIGAPEFRSEHPGHG